MSTFTTRDDVTIYYKDWGPRDGAPVILSHGWPLNADSWESQASSRTARSSIATSRAARFSASAGRAPWSIKVAPTASGCRA